MFFNSKKEKSEFKYKLSCRNDDYISEDSILSGIIENEFKLNEAVDYIYDISHTTGWITYSFKDEMLKTQINDIFRKIKTENYMLKDIQSNLHMYITDALYSVKAIIECTNHTEMKEKIKLLSMTLIEMNYDPYKILSVSDKNIIVKLKTDADRIKLLLICK